MVTTHHFQKAPQASHLLCEKSQRLGPEQAQGKVCLPLATSSFKFLDSHRAHFLVGAKLLAVRASIVAEAPTLRHEVPTEAQGANRARFWSARRAARGVHIHVPVMHVSLRLGTRGGARYAGRQRTEALDVSQQCLR